jgi:hypothetical protein
MSEEQVVGNSLVAMLSFTAIERFDNGRELSGLLDGSCETQTKAFTDAFLSSMIFLRESF